MSTPDEKSGIALQCDPSGEIIRIIRDDLGITAACDPQSTLFGIVDQHSREKAEQFLRAAVETRATFGWELNVHCGGQITVLSIVGGLTDEGIIVCGSPSRVGLNKVFDEMARIQNEQLNTLRMTAKREHVESARNRQLAQETLEEFTRLNNELVNIQRELAQRNVEIAQANVRLKALATTDGLTGLTNHREFQDALEREYTRALRYDTPLSLLMMDVDHFKQFNDQFGHPAGDSVLIQVAKILTKESRAESVVARYGGEEFAMVLPNCDSDAVAGVAERVRRAIESWPWVLRPITVSIGSATTTDSAAGRADLIARADTAMYQAKVGGRNRVCNNIDICTASIVAAT